MLGKMRILLLASAAAISAWGCPASAESPPREIGAVGPWHITESAGTCGIVSSSLPADVGERGYVGLYIIGGRTYIMFGGVSVDNTRAPTVHLLDASHAVLPYSLTGPRVVDKSGQHVVGATVTDEGLRAFPTTGTVAVTVDGRFQFRVALDNYTQALAELRNCDAGAVRGQVAAKSAPPPVDRHTSSFVPKLTADRVCGDIPTDPARGPAYNMAHGECVENEQIAYDDAKIIAPLVAPSDLQWCLSYANQAARFYQILDYCLMGKYHRTYPSEIR